jgi:hypothetical protein
MKNCAKTWLIGFMVLGAAFAKGQTAPEETNNAPRISLELPPAETHNRLALSYRMGLNISVDFRRLGGLALSDPGPTSGSAVNRNYDDGYNRVDSSGNAGGYTWYWGYQSAQSVQGGNLVLQSYSTPANAASNDRQDDPQHGLELSYSRELYRKKSWRAGLEGAFGYSLISIADSHNLKANVFRTNDSFALPGIVPPQAPYNGTFTGPGPVISSTMTPANRSVDVLPGAATITGSRSIDSDLFTIRLGPYLEVPLDDKFSLIFGGGLALVWAQTDFSFRENVTISDPTYGVTLNSGQRSGSVSQTDFLVGGYVSGSLAYAITREVSVFGGAQYQMAGHAVNTAKGKESVLDLGSSLLITFGIAYSF